jgi:putative Holliday junction resolvase
VSSEARVLGLDVGKRRIGAALAEGELGVVIGLDTLLRRTLREDIERLAILVERTHATRVVIGLPLHMDGRESPMAKEARRVAERLAAACEVPVEMHDERLTSVAAEERLAARGWSLKRLLEEKKKGAVDRLAAQILLEDWLTRHGGAPA